MQQSTQYKQEDILNSQNSTEETHNQNSTLNEREKIEDTPFWVVKQEEKWFITLGEYRVSQIKESKDEALKTLEENKWDLVIHMVIIISEKLKEEDYRKNNVDKNSHMK